MDTKEAIEFVNEIFNDWENIYCTSAGLNIEANNRLKQVIELLQRGEAYEKILKKKEENFTEKVIKENQ
ncbi:unnamed protein product [marine sediment metagenome]|uniref:Uncharacterized protein n=1 Tax=marine sediment metagenome TaxID=412755 RepID=X1T0G0_9ZZZZ